MSDKASRIGEVVAIKHNNILISEIHQEDEEEEKNNFFFFLPKNSISLISATQSPMCNRCA